MVLYANFIWVYWVGYPKESSENHLGLGYRSHCEVTQQAKDNLNLQNIFTMMSGLVKYIVLSL